MNYARITYDVRNEMDSFVCHMKALSWRRRIIAEWNLDFDFVNPLENVSFTNS